jgi:hypothetical protein
VRRRRPPTRRRIVLVPSGDPVGADSAVSTDYKCFEQAINLTDFDSRVFNRGRLVGLSAFSTGSCFGVPGWHTTGSVRLWLERPTRIFGSKMMQQHLRNSVERNKHVEAGTGNSLETSNPTFLIVQ